MFVRKRNKIEAERLGEACKKKVPKTQDNTKVKDETVVEADDEVCVTTSATALHCLRIYVLLERRELRIASLMSGGEGRGGD